MIERGRALRVCYDGLISNHPLIYLHLRRLQTTRGPSLVQAVQGHFLHYARIDLSCLALTRVGTSAMYVSEEGKIKVLLPLLCPSLTDNFMDISPLKCNYSNDLSTS